LRALRQTVETLRDRGEEPFQESWAEVFDRRYRPAVAVLLRSASSEVRDAALAETSSLDTPGLRDEWALRMGDDDEEVSSRARWTLAEHGDPRPCPDLVRRARELWRGATTGAARDVGSACAGVAFVDYVASYDAASDASERAFYRELVEGGTDLDLLESPDVLGRLESLEDHPDPFLSETAARVLAWKRKADEESSPSGALAPALLGALAFLSGTVGFLLFVLAFRLWLLSVSIRNRPRSKAASVAIGPVALEGEARPAGRSLLHPLTGEATLYYAGAERDHPQARFYLEDESGRVLVDPRRAVLLSDDDVIVAGERIRVVGYATRGQDGAIVITKDPASPPLYRTTLHRALELVFGLGRKTAVTRMLFTDPSRCFWIWDDLERRPMGESRDLLWLGGSIVLGGAFMVVFAVAVMGILDRDFAVELGRAFGSFPR
jgi:hypothetical protein